MPQTHPRNVRQLCVCELCHKQFKNANGLLQHQKTALCHEQLPESSFLSCALCLRTFFRQCDLTQHLARHPQLPSAAPGPVPVLPPPLAAAIPRAVELVVPPAAPAQPPLVGNGVGQPAAACGICLDEYTELKPMHFLPCGHTGCRPCFSTTITLSGNCPHCRKAMTVPNIGRLFI